MVTCSFENMSNLQSIESDRFHLILNFQICYSISVFKALESSFILISFLQFLKPKCSWIYDLLRVIQREALEYAPSYLIINRFIQALCSHHIQPSLCSFIHRIAPSIYVPLQKRPSSRTALWNSVDVAILITEVLTSVIQFWVVDITGT